MASPRMSWLACVLPSRMVLSLLLYAFFIHSASAQSNSSTISANITVIPETTSFTTTSITSSGTQTLALVNVLPTVQNVTLTIAAITPTTSSRPNATASASSTPTPNPTALATKIDPAFGVLGAVLILTGLPSAFLGHKNRWSVHTPSVYFQPSPSVLGLPFSS
jgi:hypothetical protein